MDNHDMAGSGEEFKFDTDIFMTRYSPSSMLSATLQEADAPFTVKTEPEPEPSPRVKAEPGLPVVKSEPAQSMSSDELAQHYLQSALLTLLLAQSLPMTLPPSSATSPVVPEQQISVQSKKEKKDEAKEIPSRPVRTKTEKTREASPIRKDRPRKRKSLDTTATQPDLICPTCFSGPFCKPFTLKRHITRRHEGLRPFKCDHPGCDLTFAENSTLKRHIMTHTGERPYNCNWPGCTKTFADRTNVKRHKTVHEGKLPFRCPDPKCIRGYATDEELQAHMSKYEHGLA